MNTKLINNNQELYKKGFLFRLSPEIRKEFMKTKVNEIAKYTKELGVRTSLVRGRDHRLVVCKEGKLQAGFTEGFEIKGRVRKTNVITILEQIKKRRPELYKEGFTIDLQCRLYMAEDVPAMVANEFEPTNTFIRMPIFEILKS